MGNYKNRGNNNRNYNNDNNNNREQRKHSGAKISTMKKGSMSGMQCIVAWNYSRGKGLVKLLLTPYSNTKQHPSGNSKIWENWMVKVFYNKSGQEFTTSALVEVTSSGNIIKAIINKLGWVVNPKAPNGGYCGTFTRK